ncbi:MAG: hypothetical protein CM15mP6_0260 [Methanobacteriota archaeon]|nr:MAG: hypothetical protein CM15mP6_0260 [Euryarchaeota archaeon]
MPVFEIHVFNEISDEDAADYRSQVTDNMGILVGRTSGVKPGTAAMFPGGGV